MKKILQLAICVCLVGALSVDAAHAASSRTARKSRSLAQVCTKKLSVAAAKTIYKQSAPLRRGGVGTPLIGYRKEPTLIFNANNFSGSRFTIHDKNGNQITSCPRMSAHGHKGRARCTASTAGVRRAAIAKTKSPTIYFKINSNTCVEVVDAGRCQGSVKGLCNQLIK